MNAHIGGIELQSGSGFLVSHKDNVNRAFSALTAIGQTLSDVSVTDPSEPQFATARLIRDRLEDLIMLLDQDYESDPELDFFSSGDELDV